MENHLLSLLIWLPILAGVLIIGTGDDRRAGLARKLSLGIFHRCFRAEHPALHPLRRHHRGDAVHRTRQLD